MKNVHKSARAEVRPKILARHDSALVVTLTAAHLKEIMTEAVIEGIAEFKAGERPAPDLLSGAQMAEKLGISRSKLHQLRTEEGCPSVKIGEVFRFERAAVMAWLHGRGKQ